MTTQLSSITGVMGIATDVLREWTSQLTGGPGVPTIVSAVAGTALLLGLYWVGRHQFFLRALAALVALMGVAFVFTAVLVAWLVGMYGKPNPKHEQESQSDPE